MSSILFSVATGIKANKQAASALIACKPRATVCFGSLPRQSSQLKTANKSRFATALDAAFQWDELKKDMIWGLGLTAFLALFPPHLQALLVPPVTLLVCPGYRFFKSFLL